MGSTCGHATPSQETLKLRSSVRAFLKNASGYGISEALFASLDLGILASIAETGSSVSDMGEALHVDPDGLRKLIRILEAGEILDAKIGTGLISPSPLLNWCSQNDEIDSLLHWVASCREFKGLWEDFADHLHQNTKPTQFKTNQAFWEWCYRDQHSTTATTLSFQWLARLAGIALAKTIDLGGPHLIVDVGGGSGGLVVEYLRRHNEAKGICVDLPAPLSFLTHLARSARMADRVTALESDMFTLDGMPNADVIVLSWIIHDLPDEDAIQVLNACRSRLRPHGALVIIEALQDRADALYMATLSGEMFLATGRGKERSHCEYATLLEESGLAIEEVHQSLDWRSIMVVRPTSHYASGPGANALDGPELSDRLTHVWLTQRFGSQGREQDLAVILHPQPTLGSTLASLCDSITVLHTALASEVITPTFEWASALQCLGCIPTVHLLLYAHPWLFLQCESIGAGEAILGRENYGTLVTIKAAEGIRRHYDLIQKATNSLVLLMNERTELQSLVRQHAMKTAQYIVRFWPAAYPAGELQGSALSMPAALDFYRDLAIMTMDN